MENEIIQIKKYICKKLINNPNNINHCIEEYLKWLKDESYDYSMFYDDDEILDFDACITTIAEENFDIKDFYIFEIPTTGVYIFMSNDGKKEFSIVRGEYFEKEKDRFYPAYVDKHILLLADSIEEAIKKNNL